MAKKTRRRINCSDCSYFSDRKWNLERHYEKVHNQLPTPQQSVTYWNQTSLDKMPFVPVGRSERALSSGESWFQTIDQFSKFQSRIANSGQTFNRVNSLESKVSTLENQLRELHQHNWIVPRSYVQGLSGHICTICKTFSFKLVMDLGYDITMQRKHNCFQPIGVFTIPIPPEVHDVDRWAAGILFNQISYLESIGNRLQLDEITKVFNVYKGNEYRDLIFGIPDRHPLVTLEDNFLTDLIDSTIRSPEKRLLMRDSQILDLLTKTKSTYGILEIPQEDDFVYYYMRILK